MFKETCPFGVTRSVGNVIRVADRLNPLEDLTVGTEGTRSPTLCLSTLSSQHFPVIGHALLWLPPLALLLGGSSKVWEFGLAAFE